MTEEKDNQEMELIQPSGDTRKVSVGVILVALYAILAILPMSGFIGAGGISSALSFAVCIAPLIGFLLGAVRGFVYGFIAGIIGTFVLLPFGGGVFLFLPPTILGPAIAGLFTGLLLKGETKIGPLLTAAYLLVIIILFEIFKFEAWWFMLPYMLAAIIAVVLQFKEIKFDWNRTGISKYLQLVPFMFVGVMLDHSMMAMGSVFLLDLPAVVGFSFALIFPLMILERVVATILASIIGFIILSYFGTEIGLTSNQEI
ncbi:MAG: hypothetical protein KAU48_02595 [Candidatus Thorarchaeota archaeon]|nr:hypothetical protein [Candidatus Thorarchaeota archaeon]